MTEDLNVFKHMTAEQLESVVSVTGKRLDLTEEYDLGDAWAWKTNLSKYEIPEGIKMVSITEKLQSDSVFNAYEEYLQGLSNDVDDHIGHYLEGMAI